MYVTLLRSKLHGATVTGAVLDYQGSITIDSSLLKAAGILPHEKVLVANMNNGERFETYALPGKPGSRTICLNGATVHKGKIGDKVIIFTFAQMTLAEAKRHHPKVIVLGSGNRPRPKK